MNEPGAAPIGAAPVPGAARGRGAVLRPFAVAVVAGGAVLGAAWRLGLPLARGLRDTSAPDVASDGWLALLFVLGGLFAAVILALRPGPRPAVRLALSLVGAGLAALVAWGVGRVLGAPPLQAPGVLVILPLVLAVLTLVRTIVELLIHGE